MRDLRNIFMSHRKIPPEQPGINECASYFKRRVIGVVWSVELQRRAGPSQHPRIQFWCPWAWRDVLRPRVEQANTRPVRGRRRREQLFLDNPPLIHVAVLQSKPAHRDPESSMSCYYDFTMTTGFYPRSLCASMVVRWFSIPALITALYIAPYLIFYTRSSLCALALNTDCNPITPGIKRSFN